MRKAVLTGWLVLSAAVLTPACTDPVPPESTTPPVVDDHEFDAGSRIADQNLTTIQIENLALLAKVWGFAKYHDPRVVDSSRNWDYDLFRAIPSVLAAPDRAAASAALVTWLDELGPVPSCSPCAQLASGAPLQPENGWIAEGTVLGTALSERLVAIHRNRPASGSQRYLAFQLAGNPDFSMEAKYPTHEEPDAGYRLLALFRLWNIVDYWFPYRDVMDEDWDSVLREFVPEMMLPMGRLTYWKTLIRLIAQVHDTHANIWSHISVQPPTGIDDAPLVLRFVEGKLAVTGYAHRELGPATGMQPGDVIHSVDGVGVESIVDSLQPYYPASNQAARLRDIARKVTRGTGPVLLEGVGADGAFSRVVSRAPLGVMSRIAYDHDLPGPVFRMLSDSVAYLKVSFAVAQNAAEYIVQARDAAVLVIDIRNYPNDFMVFALGGHLVPGPVPFARFTKADPSNPGAFLWTEPVMHTPREPTFAGKVVILVDEDTQSSAEYTTMAFRVAPEAIVVGSTTAGADGNVSRIPLPGDVEGMISGIGVFYPDGTPTQRVGVIPDLVVRPTIEGIRAGRDEVLEAGVSHALGRDFQLSVYRPPSTRQPR